LNEVLIVEEHDVGLLYVSHSWLRVGRMVHPNWVDRVWICP
jgi:hypothetical protein